MECSFEARAPAPWALFCSNLKRAERLRVQIRANVRGLLVVAFVLGSMLVILALMLSQPLDALATPTPVCIEEIEVISAVFLAFVAVMQPAEDALARSGSPLSRLLRMKVEVPRPIRAVALITFVGGSFAFAFWAAADVLGGYNGYSYSFFVHPVLLMIYNDTVSLVPYLNARDKGTQASFYFGLAMLGLATFTLNRGVGKAILDTITLFAAPCLVVFELALWNYAPEDMTWHVTDYLWMGGLADNGVRPLDSGGPYLFSNWLVLCVALFLVASRIPWMSLPSRIIWRRRGTELQGDGLEGPAGRNSSAHGAFEPTTLRYLWPE